MAFSMGTFCDVDEDAVIICSATEKIFCGALMNGLRTEWGVPDVGNDPLRASLRHPG